MDLRIDKEGFMQKVKEVYGERVELLSEYQGTEKRLTICYHCEKHGDTVKEMKAKSLWDRNFNPCKKCCAERRSASIKESWTHDVNYYYDRLVSYCKEHGLTVKETEWVTAKTKYHFKCSNPEHPEFITTADSLIGKHESCPYCCGRRGNFADEFKHLVELRGGTMLGKYENAAKTVKVMCNKHHHVWELNMVNLKKGRWCSLCNASVNEYTVWEWLIDNGYHPIHQYKFDSLIGDVGNPYRFDFGIVDDNGKLMFIIEVDDYSHNSNEKTIRTDAIKNDYCKQNNITLYRMKISPDKIRRKGRDWYYQYIDEYFKFLKTNVA